MEAARIRARTGQEMDAAYRRWVVQVGGVYVPTGEGSVSPSPYYPTEEADAATASGTPLTLVRPAHMMRLVHEVALDPSQVRGHLTSHQPIRPENAPDEWERDALEALQAGVSEVSAVVQLEGKPFLRLMRPVLAKSDCLQCHTNQGLRPGDVAGGLSVSVPMAPHVRAAGEEIAHLGIVHGVTWAIGLGGIFLALRGFLRSERHRSSAEDRIRHLNSVLHAIRRVGRHTSTANDPHELIENACESLVETRGYLSAWILRIDQEHRILDCGRAGEESVSFVAVAKAEVAVPDCAEEALRRKEPVIVDIPSPACEDCSLRTEGAGRQNLCVRLEAEGCIYGVLSVSTDSDVRTDVEEQDLLEEFAGDIAFGLAMIEQRRQREATERELRESREKFKDFIEFLPQTVFESDLRGRIVMANRSAYDTFGYDDADMETGLYLTQLVAPEDRKAAEEGIRKIIAGWKSPGNEYTALRKDGSTFPAIINSRVLLQDGKPAGIRGILVDITRQKETEDQLRKSVDDLERFNRLAVNRELRMIELKREVNELARKTGVTPPYDLEFAHESALTEGGNA